MLEFRNNDQFKSYMKKESSRLGISVNNAYKTYIARTFLQRLSKNNEDELLIKGSSAEISYLGTLVRAITDLDIATTYTGIEGMHIVVDAMNDTSCDQFKFNLNHSLKKTKTGIYKLELSCKFGQFSEPLGIDLQENYNRLIEPTRIIMPKIFEGDELFPVYVPSFEEYLAEKMCIVIENNKSDVLNTRVKDFYDIYQLHGGKYDTDKLTEYFAKMLELRNKIKLENASTMILDKEYIEKHQSIWDSTVKKYDFVDKEIDLSGAVYYTRAVIREKLQKNGIEMTKNPELIKKI